MARPAARAARAVFGRVFGRHLMSIAVLAVAPLVFLSTLNRNLTLFADPDIWWHLANARLFTSTHHFIRVEPYSFTVAGQQWINPEWLAELPYWFAYRHFGLQGIYLLTWLFLCANLLLLYWRGYARSRHAGAAFWAASIVFVLMTVNSGPRTIVPAYLALSTELLILERFGRGDRRSLWLLPPLFAVWINLHGSWLIGMALFALYILCGLVRIRVNVIEQDALSSGERRLLLLVFAASAAALLLNPYGWRLIWSPFDMIFRQTLNIATVAEWQPLRLGSPVGTGVAVAIGLMVVANCISSRRWKLYELALVFFAWYAAIDHVRFTFLAAVLTGPLLADDIERSFCSGSDRRTIPVINALISVGVACLFVFSFPSEAALERRLGQFFPVKTIRSLNPSWRTFNWDLTGGMMDFESRTSFIDSRVDIFEHRGVFQDYLRAMNLNDSLEVLDRYRVDHVLVLDRHPISYLLKRTAGWRVTRQEPVGRDLYLLFARDPLGQAPQVAAAIPAGRKP